MKTVELYARVRHAILIEGISERAAADRFGINARTISKMLNWPPWIGLGGRLPSESLAALPRIPHVDRLRRASAAFLGNKIIEKGLAFLREWSVTGCNSRTA